MNATAISKTKKTFPLEIEESLHKALKHKAIESDMSLHAYIIDALISRVNEETAVQRRWENGRKRGGKVNAAAESVNGFQSDIFSGTDLVQIIQGDVRQKLSLLLDDTFHCCVTSPPYWGMLSLLICNLRSPPPSK